MRLLVLALVLVAAPAWAQRPRPADFGDRDPDRRPDPEDAAAYNHADTVIKPAQSARTRVALQLLRYSLGRNRRPTDVSDGWASKNIAAPPAGYDCWVDVYDGPRGLGYVVNYEVRRGADTYRKSINYGPEKYRESDWTKVAEVTP